MSDAAPDKMRPVALAASTPTAALRELAAREGWEVIGDRPRGHLTFRARLWRTPGGHEVFYGEDHLSGTRFVNCAATTDEEVAALTARVAAAAPVETQTQVLDRLVAATEPAGIIAALLTYAAFITSVSGAGDELDARLVPLLTRLAGHENRHVRRAVKQSVFGLASRWPEVAAAILEE